MNGRLTRSRDAMIGGVAAGVAAWVKVDPALVRIAWALLVPLTSGAALLAYIVAWVVVPEEPEHDVPVVDATDPDAPVTGTAERPAADEGRATLLIGGGLVLIGLWFLVREYLPRIDWSFIWPLIIVGVGVLILVGAARRR
ncbi:MAG: PspC domain-containing protein [Chloroflexi bacterium]|nr:PspC domain-containing protein [Chloroflexota bacterium]